MPGLRTALNLSLAALALSAAAAPARAAGTLVSTSAFSLTFPEGWQIFSFSQSDTLKLLINQGLQATCYVTAHTSDQPITAQQIAASIKAYGMTDSVTQTSDSTLTLGGKAFSYVEFKGKDPSDSTMARFYYASSGNLLFTAYVGYTQGTGSSVVTSINSALATLTLNGAAGLRAAEWKRPEWHPSNHDALGRMRPLEARTALFRLPSY